MTVWMKYERGQLTAVHRSTKFVQNSTNWENLEVRLSCRNADWLGAYDRDELKKVSPTGEVSVLLLNPLSDDDVNKILEAHPNVENPQQLIDFAYSTGLSGILRNPQSLIFLAEAAASEILAKQPKRNIRLVMQVIARRAQSWTLHRKINSSRCEQSA